MKTIFIWLSIFVYLLSFLSVTVRSENDKPDICNKYGVLHYLDMFYLSQKIERTVHLDLSEFRDIFVNLQTNIPPFLSQLQQYDTAEELDGLEPVKLIPFTEDLNLIKISSVSGTDFSETCKKYNASLLPIEPITAAKLNKILKSESLAKVPVGAYIIEGKIISLKGQIMHSLPASDAANYLTNYKTLTLMLHSDDTLGLETTPSASIEILCSKINNPFDLPSTSSMRNLWLKTVSKIQSTLPVIAKWGNLVGRFMYDLPTGTASTSSPTPAPTTADLQISPPTPLMQLANFITKFSFGNHWTQLAPSGFSDFLKYCDNFKSLLTAFTSTNAPSTSSEPKLQRWSNANPENRRFPSVLNLEIEPERILKYLSLELNFKISGPVFIQPLSTGRTWHSGPKGALIKAIITFRVYDSDSPAYLYQIKPVYYKNQITSMKYLIKWSTQSITFSNQPALLRCTKHSSDFSAPDIKVCHNFQQPGQTQADVTQRTNCAKVLLNEIGDYSNCMINPYLPASTDIKGNAVGIRAECSGYDQSVAIISSTAQRIKILIRCSVRSSKDIVLSSFPTYIETSCPIYLIQNNGDPTLLIPDSQAQHLSGQTRTLDFLINSPPPPLQPLPEETVEPTTIANHKTVTRKTRTSPRPTTTSFVFEDDEDYSTSLTEPPVSESFDFKEFFQNPTKVLYFSITIIAILAVMILTICLICYCKCPSCIKDNCLSDPFLKCKSENEDGCSNCCCFKKHEPTSPETPADLALDSESEIEIAPVRSRTRTNSVTSNSSRKYRLDSLSETELNELSKLMQQRINTLNKDEETNLSPSAPVMAPANNTRYAPVPSKSNLSNFNKTASNLNSMSRNASVASSMGSIRSAPSVSGQRPRQIVSHTFREK